MHILEKADKKSLIKALDNFQDAYKSVVRNWVGTEFEEYGADRYPFKKSFDELSIEAWIKSFKKELTSY